VTTALLHLTTPAQWRAALGSGVIAPPSLREAAFVHLSTPEQVALPAARLFPGRRDLVLLVLDPDRIGVPVRFEPGVAGDPAAMRFPHAYGPVPARAVVAVLPYRPRPDGGFDAPPQPPAAADTAARAAALEPSLLRRTATAEVPVTGGVGVLTAPVPASYQHNQLIVDGDATAAEVVAAADRVLGGAGLAHRKALLTGPGLAATAAGLRELGWDVEHLVRMAMPAGGAPSGRVEVSDRENLRATWDAAWRRELPAATGAEIAQLTDRYRLEEAVLDLRYLAVRDAGAVAASCLLKIDGATALLDAVATEPAFRGRGHGDALLRHARALAAEAGCDLVVLEALATDWPRRWYARRGFTEVGQSWTAGRT
jgi:uncharacterized protein (DUF952 family)/ribosomal protein S18 acetylase RimI-like enzyme